LNIKKGELIFEKRLRMIRMDKILKKIAKKFLLIPIVETWFDRIIQLYGAVQAEKELDMFNRKLEVRPNFRHYLPDTEERIERLRRVINKRPVAIILHGPSVTELEERITELEDCDICYFSLSAFRVIEKYILQKINRNLSLVMCSAAAGAQMNDIIDFLERQEDNIFISDRDAFHRPRTPQGFDLDEFIKKYDRKLLFFTFTTTRNAFLLRVPSIEYPLHFLLQNSFSILLSLALIGEAPMVAVFGGDGGRINTRELHFRESDPEYQQFNAKLDMVEHSIMDDTKVFNLMMPFTLEKISKIYNLRPVDIINCSPQSHYTPLRKLSYDETFALLKSFKKDTG